jgi:hypothetical protein
VLYATRQPRQTVRREENETSQPLVRPEPRQEPRGDVDDFIFAGDSGYPASGKKTVYVTQSNISI